MIRHRQRRENRSESYDGEDSDDEEASLKPAMVLDEDSQDEVIHEILQKSLASYRMWMFMIEVMNYSFCMFCVYISMDNLHSRIFKNSVTCFYTCGGICFLIGFLLCRLNIKLPRLFILFVAFPILLWIPYGLPYPRSDPIFYGFMCIPLISFSLALGVDHLNQNLLLEIENLRKLKYDVKSA